MPTAEGSCGHYISTFAYSVSLWNLLSARWWLVLGMGNELIQHGAACKDRRGPRGRETDPETEPKTLNGPRHRTRYKSYNQQILAGPPFRTSDLAGRWISEMLSASLLGLVLSPPPTFTRRQTGPPGAQGPATPRCSGGTKLRTPFNQLQGARGQTYSPFQVWA